MMAARKQCGERERFMPEYVLVGRQLGPYRLLQGVGRGGMAEVYLAEDQRLGRQVAVKILPAALALDETFRARFEREARAAAKLQHPHILSIYDYGQQDGITFLVMPYMANGSLAQTIKAFGHLPITKVVQWIEEIGGALQYAHQQGIIHRDVKPGNMLLGVDEHLLLSDFGIAKVVGTHTALTTTGVGVGSPEYMAPEQATGEADSRSDIYSLGVVLFQMLTGRVPFTAGSALQVIFRHVQEPPPSPRSLNPTITPAVEAVVLRALAKRPDQRFQSASELVLALKNAASGSNALPLGNQAISNSPMFPPVPDGLPGGSFGSLPTHRGSWPSQAPQPGWAIIQQPTPLPAPTFESLPGRMPAPVIEARPATQTKTGLGFKVAALILLVVLITAAFGGVAVAFYLHANTSQSGQTPPPGATATSTRAAGSPFLYQEARPFCDLPQFWQRNATATPQNTTCAADGLHLSRPSDADLTASLFLEAYPNEPTPGFPANVRLEVDTTLIGADPNQPSAELTGYGIIFRNQTGNGGYFFMIDPVAGTWLIKIERSDGTVGSLQRISSSAIQTGFNIKNHLRIDVQGSRFTGFVNGVNVGSVTDGSFASGNIGLVVAFRGMTVVFANFTMASLG